MRPSAVVAAILVTLFLACALPLFADSDGYYCTSNGYLAYELREGLTPGIKGHVLRVMRYEAGRGIYVAGEVVMKDFQPHGMACNADRVEIVGWGRIFVKYVVETIPTQGVRTAEYSDDANRKFDSRSEPTEPPNLGRCAKVGAVRLNSSDPDHSYELITTRSTSKVKGADTNTVSEVHFHAELVQLDRDRSVSQRAALFDLKDIADDSGD
jgi:hypothetical protein